MPPLDPLDPAAAAWPAIPMTPRALLEPGVNWWLGQAIGPPDSIVFTAFEVEDDDTLANPLVMTAADLALQPIDLVYIIGADIGDGCRCTHRRLGARIACRVAVRALNNLDENSLIRIRFGEPRTSPARSPWPRCCR